MAQQRTNIKQKNQLKGLLIDMDNTICDTKKADKLAIQFLEKSFHEQLSIEKKTN